MWKGLPFQEGKRNSFIDRLLCLPGCHGDGTSERKPRLELQLPFHIRSAPERAEPDSAAPLNSRSVSDRCVGIVPDAAIERVEHITADLESFVLRNADLLGESKVLVPVREASDVAISPRRVTHRIGTWRREGIDVEKPANPRPCVSNVIVAGLAGYDIVSPAVIEKRIAQVVRVAKPQGASGRILQNARNLPTAQHELSCPAADLSVKWKLIAECRHEIVCTVAGAVSGSSEGTFQRQPLHIR